MTIIVDKEIPPREFTMGYNAFSGLDIKVLIDNKQVSCAHGFKVHKNIFHMNKKHFVETKGSLFFTKFDALENLLGKVATIKAIAANEHGILHIVLEEKVLFTTVDYGITTDDIVYEEVYQFKTVEVEPIEDHIKRHDIYKQDTLSLV